ncbi:MAG: MGDG synthase family glycosyltransferase [Anaerolineae bacterium]
MSVPEVPGTGKRPLRILVLTDTMPWGHRSIARAIFGYLKRMSSQYNWEVEYTEVKAETGAIPELYSLVTRYFPETYSIAYKMSTWKLTNKVLSDVSLGALANCRQVVDLYNPDLVISTYFMHTHCLARWKNSEGKPFKLWTVVSDLWTVSFSTYILSGVDLHLVYDEVGEKVGLDLGLAPSQLLKTGWWVREEMNREYERTAAREALGITDDRPVVFVGGGSLGNSAIPRAIPLLLSSKRPLAVIFNNGTDKVSYALVQEYAKAYYRRARKAKPVQIINHGWIDNMAEVLAASDIVFGKAGPNFLMDSIAQHKPFVAISHVAGNEDGNLDLLLKRKLGWVAEKPDELRDFTKAYLANPGQYHTMFKATIAQEAERNRHSLPMIAERIRAMQESMTY